MVIDHHTVVNIGSHGAILERALNTLSERGPTVSVDAGMGQNWCFVIQTLYAAILKNFVCRNFKKLCMPQFQNDTNNTNFVCRNFKIIQIIQTLYATISK